jgi:hypothetical protein
LMLCGFLRNWRQKGGHRIGFFRANEVSENVNNVLSQVISLDILLKQQPTRFLDCHTHGRSFS